MHADHFDAVPSLYYCTPTATLHFGRRDSAGKQNALLATVGSFLTQNPGGRADPLLTFRSLHESKTSLCGFNSALAERFLRIRAERLMVRPTLSRDTMALHDHWGEGISPLIAAAMFAAVVNFLSSLAAWISTRLPAPVVVPRCASAGEVPDARSLVYQSCQVQLRTDNCEGPCSIERAAVLIQARRDSLSTAGISMFAMRFSLLSHDFLLPHTYVRPLELCWFVLVGVPLPATYTWIPLGLWSVWTLCLASHIGSLMFLGLHPSSNPL